MRQIFEGKHVVVLEHDGWEFVERKKGKSAVVILAVTSNDRIILVEQLRRPVNARVIDFPAGLVGDEDGSRPARRRPASPRRRWRSTAPGDSRSAEQEVASPAKTSSSTASRAATSTSG